MDARVLPEHAGHGARAGGENNVCEEIANKFFEHFLYVASAMNNAGGKGFALWDDDDGFFYDVPHTPAGEPRRLKVRSLVGLIPLPAVETIEPDLLRCCHGSERGCVWFATITSMLSWSSIRLAQADG